MKQIIITLLLSTLSIYSHAFCGFYVAKADADLFNESSQVIITRYDNQTVITMANDFQGEVKDFAMVVPVPVVLQENDIRIAQQNIFDKLDAYSGPRLAEYHDDNPCYERKLMKNKSMRKSMSTKPSSMTTPINKDKDLGVKIEATYTIGEYNILILSAEQSDGLETWLLQNDYKIPENAKEVLTPYIKDEMKFFVVKVNLEQQKKEGYNNLRPLQMSFNSPRFGLPIRLGMANAKDYQDLIIYAFTKKGRVETTNYRTAKIPTDRNIPLFVEEDFGNFYKSVFDNAWERENKKAVMLEYAWDLSSSNFVKCDPCATTPPNFSDLKEAGVHWVDEKGQNNNRFGNTSNYQGDVFFTRLHVRYNRDNYPQDLRFQETPNKERFQGRYVMHQPARGKMNCPLAKQYITDLYDRRQRELSELTHLTAWKETQQFENYLEEVKTIATNAPAMFRPKGFGINTTHGIPNTDPTQQLTEPTSTENTTQTSNYHWYYFLLGALVMLFSGLFFFKPK